MQSQASENNGVDVLELCAAAVLNRSPPHCGHVLLLHKPGTSDPDHALRAYVERGLRSSRKLPHITLSPAVGVEALAEWLYAADLGQAEGRKERPGRDGGEDTASDSEVSSLYDGATPTTTPQNAALHHLLDARRRVAFVHRLHLASEEVQACLVGALQHNTVYGAPVRKLELLTIIATCDAVSLAQVSHVLRERFFAAACLSPDVTASRQPLPSNGESSYKLSKSVHQLLAEDPVVSSEKIFGARGKIHPETGVYVDSAVLRYLLQCVARCRSSQDCSVLTPSHDLIGASCRGLRAFSVVSGKRDFVTPEDVRRLLPHMLFHRTVVNPTVALDEADDSSLIVLHPKQHRAPETYWNSCMNEDLLHCVVASVYDTTGASSEPFTASLAASAWTHVNSVLSKIPVPL